MEQAGGQRAGDGRGQRGGDPDAGVLDDVAHLEHTGAQTLTDQTAHAVFLIAHDGEADHLGAAARHRRAARKAGQAQCRADGRRRDGQGQRHAHDDRYEDAHDQRGLFGSPHDQGAHLTCRRTDGGRDEHGEADADKNSHQRGHKNIDLGLLAHGLAQLRCHDGNDEDGQRAARSAQGVGRVAHRDKAEQHQRRAVERPTDRARHSRAAHGCGIAAQIHQHLKPGLLAQRLDDGADQQAGKQALCHCAQRLDQVALGGNDDIFSFQKLLEVRHRNFRLSSRHLTATGLHVHHHTIHLSRQQVKFSFFVKRTKFFSGRRNFCAG